MRRLIPLLAIALALSSCVRVTFRSSSSREVAQPVPILEGSPHGRRPPVPVPDVLSRGPSSLKPKTVIAGTTQQNDSSHFPINFDMPACIERTRPARATIRTAKLSMIIASAAYADGEGHGGLWTGSTDAGGVYTLAWTPPPDAPLGAAKILVGVNGDSGGATAQRHFVLAAPGGCR